MKPIAFVLAILGAIAAVGGIVLLITNIAADANALTSLIACALFLGGSILAASSWVKALNITITPNITGNI